VQADGMQYRKAWDGAAWRPSHTAWESTGGIIDNNPAVVCWRPNRIDLFSVTAGLGLAHLAWTGTEWLLHRWPSKVSYRLAHWSVLTSYRLPGIRTGSIPFPSAPIFTSTTRRGMALIGCLRTWDGTTSVARSAACTTHDVLNVLEYSFGHRLRILGGRGRVHASSSKVWTESPGSGGRGGARWGASAVRSPIPAQRTMASTSRTSRRAYSASTCRANTTL
jgi:hypothetical protein